MRNHSEKVRDVARSVLPSTARKGARETRAQIHGRERARERRLLHELSRAVDPDDVELDVESDATHSRMMADMIEDRRAADKVGPLLRWAERTVERDPKLADASPEDRVVHFRTLLPPGLIGNHAISHLWGVLDDRPRHWIRGRRDDPATNPDVQLVRDIIAAGRHGDLNRRIRAGAAPVELHTVRLPPERVIDDEHPAPGVLLPYRIVTERRPRRVRFLAGAHDVEAFVSDAGWDLISVVRAFHAEEIRPRSPTTGRT